MWPRPGALHCTLRASDTCEKTHGSIGAHSHEELVPRSRGGEGRRRKEGVAPVLKSRDPHLSGGEVTGFRALTVFIVAYKGNSSGPTSLVCKTI